MSKPKRRSSMVHTNPQKLGHGRGSIMDAFLSQHLEEFPDDKVYQGDTSELIGERITPRAKRGLFKHPKTTSTNNNNIKALESLPSLEEAAIALETDTSNSNGKKKKSNKKTKQKRSRSTSSKQGSSSLYMSGDASTALHDNDVVDTATTGGAGGTTTTTTTGKSPENLFGKLLSSLASSTPFSPRRKSMGDTEKDMTRNVSEVFRIERPDDPCDCSDKNYSEVSRTPSSTTSYCSSSGNTSNRSSNGGGGGGSSQCTTPHKSLADSNAEVKQALLVLLKETEERQQKEEDEDDTVLVGSWTRDAVCIPSPEEVMQDCANMATHNSYQHPYYNTVPRVLDKFPEVPPLQKFEEVLKGHDGGAGGGSRNSPLTSPSNKQQQQQQSEASSSSSTTGGIFASRKVKRKRSSGGAGDVSRISTSPSSSSSSFMSSLLDQTSASASTDNSNSSSNSKPSAPSISVLSKKMKPHEIYEEFQRIRAENYLMRERITDLETQQDSMKQRMRQEDARRMQQTQMQRLSVSSSPTLTRRSPSPRAAAAAAAAEGPSMLVSPRAQMLVFDTSNSECKQHNLIGAGGNRTCKVYRYKVGQGGSMFWCAGKVMERSMVLDEDERDFLSEIAILSQLPHSNHVVRYLFHSISPERIVMWMSLYDSTLDTLLASLRDFQHSAESTSCGSISGKREKQYRHKPSTRSRISSNTDAYQFEFEEEEIYVRSSCTECRLSKEVLVSLAQSVCNAGEFLHRQGVIHRDMKSSNVFITYSKHPQLVTSPRTAAAAAGAQNTKSSSSSNNNTPEAHNHNGTRMQYSVSDCVLGDFDVSMILNHSRRSFTKPCTSRTSSSSSGSGSVTDEPEQFATLSCEASIGTPGFMAPEILYTVQSKHNKSSCFSVSPDHPGLAFRYSEKSDVFAYGMLLYELMMLHQPFELEEYDPQRISRAILDGEIPYVDEFAINTYPSVYQLFIDCTQYLPSKRPAFRDIQKYTW